MLGDAVFQVLATEYSASFLCRDINTLAKIAGWTQFLLAKLLYDDFLSL